MDFHTLLYSFIFMISVIYVTNSSLHLSIYFWSYYHCLLFEALSGPPNLFLITTKYITYSVLVPYFFTTSGFRLNTLESLLISFLDLYSTRTICIYHLLAFCTNLVAVTLIFMKHSWTPTK